MAVYAARICGTGRCPNDDAFEHDNYFGCVPKDFSERTGRSKTHRQTKGPDGRFRWNGGCDAAPLPRAREHDHEPASDDTKGASREDA